MELFNNFFEANGALAVLTRASHILVGITWIGLLYFFNFVQVPAYAELSDGARSEALRKLTFRALWWFRYAALLTFASGLVLVGLGSSAEKTNYLAGPTGTAILTGMLFGITMFLNVWGVIWRNQKVVLANAANLVAGGEADPGAAAAGRRAFMASRQNVVFSVAMLFFMVFKTHSPVSGELVSSGKMGAYWAIAIVIIAVLELNALGLLPWKATPNKGLNMMYDGPGVRNVLVSAFGVWFVFMILSEIFLKA